jgi:hypothetical protein
VQTTAVQGDWWADNRSTLAVMDAIASGAGVYYGPDWLGVLRMQRLDLPTGAPVGLLASWNTAAVEVQPTPEGVPTLNVQLRYARYHAPLRGADVASTASAAVRADVAEEWRVSERSGTISPNPYRATNTLELETRFAYKADADAEALRVFNLRSQPMRVLLAKGVNLADHRLQAVDVNSVVALRWHEHGLSPSVSQPFCVIGIQDYDLVTRQANLLLWGPAW